MALSDEELRYEIRFSDEVGNTVLHIAALNNFPYAALSRLVQCGCDINALDTSGHTALTFSVSDGFFATFYSLALLGADLSIKYPDGNIWQLPEDSPTFIALLGSHGLREGK
jgi:ankyrin repeat protein